MSALVKTIKSRLTDDTIYPVTKADAVYMGSSTVSTVEGQINDINILLGNTTLKTTNQNVTSAINQLIDDYILIGENFTSSSSVSIATHTTGTITISTTKVGYVPFALVGLFYAGTGIESLAISSYHFNPQQQLVLKLYNNSSSTVTVSSIILAIMFKKLDN